GCYFFFFDSLACDQHLEAFPPAGGGGEVLELERDFGALLGQAAVFEGVGKLGSFADAPQELRLRDQLLTLHALLIGGRGQCCEVYVGGDVLFTGGFVGVGADGMLSYRFKRTAMAPGKLLGAGVAVVYDDEQSAIDGGGDLAHVVLRAERSLDAFPGFRMNGVAIEEFQFSGRGWGPGFDEAVFARVDAEGALRAGDFDGGGAEEFFGQREG